MKVKKQLKEARKHPKKAARKIVKQARKHPKRTAKEAAKLLEQASKHPKRATRRLVKEASKAVGLRKNSRQLAEGVAMGVVSAALAHRGARAAKRVAAQ